MGKLAYGFFLIPGILGYDAAFGQIGNNAGNLSLNGSAMIESTFNGEDYNTTQTFYDGFGRPVKKIAQQATSGFQDIVEYVIYDCMGRPDSISYLPYAGTAEDNIDECIFQQQMFYSSFSEDGEYAYSLKKYDTSPLGIVEEASSPGEYYNINSSVGHPVKFNLRTNNTLDHVKKFAIRNDSFLYFEKWYGADQLTVKEQIAENSPSVTTTIREYIDNDGVLIAKSAQANADEPRFSYYVYDNDRNLIFEIPYVVEKQITQLHSKYSPSSFCEYWRHYKYDKYGNRIQINNPGMAPLFYLHDMKGRVVMTQDGNQRLQKQWTYMKYDDYNRLYQLWVIQSNMDKEKIRTCFRDYYPGFGDASMDIIAPTAQTLLVEYQYGGYDNYEALYQYEQPQSLPEQPIIPPGSEEPMTGPSDPPIIVDPSLQDHFPIDPPPIISYPVSPVDPYGPNVPPIDSLHLCPPIEPDDNSPQWDILGRPGGKYTLIHKIYNEFSIPAYLRFEQVDDVVSYSDLYSDNTELKIYDKLAIIPDVFENSGLPKYIERAYYYDKKGRIIQSVVKNQFGGLSRLSNKYDFMGNLLLAHESREMPETGQTDIKIREYEYDSFGRLLSERTRLNDSPEAVVHYAYDEFGRRTEVYYGENYDFYDTYSYDISGRLISQDNKFFEMSLERTSPRYGESEPSYTGLITEYEWNQKDMDNGSQRYSFSYTPYGQLAEANNPNYNSENNITYDDNGNILTLYRDGVSEILDNSTYNSDFEYRYEGNRLVYMIDNEQNSERKFSYDANGNLVSDIQRQFGVQNFWEYQYNCLNLIENIYGSHGCRFYFQYLADGTKIRCNYWDDIHYLYNGSLIYKQTRAGTELESTNFSAGRIVKTSEGYQVLYYTMDYQNNVRVIFDQGGNILERNDYYPFGTRWGSEDYPRTENNFQYNGQQYLTLGDDMTFFNIEIGILDFGGRTYDPGIGRWSNPDPAMQHINPFMYCSNNPVNFIDQNGLWDKTNGGYTTNDPNEIASFWEYLSMRGLYSGLSMNSVEKYIQFDMSHGSSGGSQGNAEWKAGLYKDSEVGSYFSLIPADMVHYKNSHKSEWVNNDVFLNQMYMLFGSNENSVENIAVNISGSFCSFLSMSNGTVRLTAGTYNQNIFKPKYYPSGWRGGSLAGIKTYKLAPVGEALGVAGLAWSYYSNYEQARNGTKMKEAAAFDGTMNTIAFINPTFGIPYGLSEAFLPGGFRAVVEAYAETQAHYQHMSEKYWWCPMPILH